ncbi:endonuclease/exonuclease/phosphatase family protein [Armatimonas sp.]|uniref:endonuclease/exonuclease/phosphatase family protein n=1 Tax=Armatimonas sp. TaxID=1872638 RepID=UPI0037503D69
MMTFLFWNINRRFPEEALQALVRAHDVDVLILAEAGESSPAKIGELFHSPGRTPTALILYSRHALLPLEEAQRWTMRSVTTTQGELLIVGTHLPSGLHFSEQDRAMEASHFSRAIRGLEERRGHERTLLVGDLNMNPFEMGVVGTEGLHAVSSQQVAQEGKRTVQGREYPFFYNPMWVCLGDAASPTAGTYYYRKANPICYFWNTFDQVLIRPSLLPFWMPEELKILTRVGDITLVNSKGRPDSSRFSDHLPIVFRLDL